MEVRFIVFYGFASSGLLIKVFFGVSKGLIFKSHDIKYSAIYNEQEWNVFTEVVFVVMLLLHLNTLHPQGGS